MIGMLRLKPRASSALEALLFNGVRPFFCQIEAVETAIWLSEVAPTSSLKAGGFWIIWLPPTRTLTLN